MINNEILHRVMDHHLLEMQPDEWGVVIHCPDPKSIGFATTLTPAIIRQAIDRKIDLIITHHDAWELMREERQAAHKLLHENQLSHIWCHGPLDKADDGTAATLLGLIGCKIIGKIAQDDGRIGELPNNTELSAIVGIFDRQISEAPARIHDAKKSISLVGCVPGAGMRVEYLAEALAYQIDLFITGETSLYLLEYAAYHGVSVLIYSHNYTEIFATENFARKIAAQLAIDKIVRLDEPHF